MIDSIEILIPAACVKTAGVVVAHERLAQAATHGMPQKIHSAIKSYLQKMGSEDFIQLAEGVRLNDGEIVFTVLCEAADLQHPIDLAVLRNLIYTKLGMKERLVHLTTPNSDAPEQCEPTHIENAGVDVLPDAFEESATTEMTSSMPLSERLPTEVTNSVPAQDEMISGFMPDNVSSLVDEAREPCNDESASGTNPAPSEDHEELPETAAQGEVVVPANTKSTSAVSTFDQPAADHTNQLMKIKDADVAVDRNVNVPVLAENESREADRDVNGESYQDRPVPDLVLQNPIVEEEFEIVEMCSDVLLVTLRGVDASRVVVLDPTVAATITPGMNLADRLTGVPRKCGGLWELRSFRFEDDDSDE